MDPPPKRARFVGPKKALRSLRRQERTAKVLSNAPFVSLPLAVGGLATSEPRISVPLAAAGIGGFPLWQLSRRVDASVIKKAVGRPALAKRLAAEVKDPNIRDSMRFLAMIGPIQKGERRPIHEAIDSYYSLRTALKTANSGLKEMQKSEGIVLERLMDAHLKRRLKESPELYEVARLVRDELRKGEGGYNPRYLSLYKDVMFTFPQILRRFESDRRLNPDRTTFDLEFGGTGKTKGIRITRERDGRIRIVRIDR
ncbi:MAG: hypothetical protein JXB14_00070 [Candidatus Altiarchaeota archaeon]|nr:hypothetical protein [Candidatus Altiarchaeota archaeon]